MKDFFGITASNYQFEIGDVMAIFTLLNVALILAGFWWAPLFGLVNCGIAVTLNIKNHAHINAWLTQVALIVLNMYFLTL